MTGYTSGKTHHDPLPHIDAHGRRFEEAYTAPYRDCRQCTTTYDPRPEFDNHNPILSTIRECATIEPASWLDTPLIRGELPMAAYRVEHIDHARRVLSKLAALNG
jgi:hypothetical protein